jgi:catechol 1,2-dioxygenase
MYMLILTDIQVPGDGPAGKLLDLLDRHHYRPGHIHLIVRSAFNPVSEIEC